MIDVVPIGPLIPLSPLVEEALEKVDRDLVQRQHSGPFGEGLDAAFQHDHGSRAKSFLDSAVASESTMGIHEFHRCWG